MGIGVAIHLSSLWGHRWSKFERIPGRGYPACGFGSARHRLRNGKLNSLTYPSHSLILTSIKIKGVRRSFENYPQQTPKTSQDKICLAPIPEIVGGLSDKALSRRISPGSILRHRRFGSRDRYGARCVRLGAVPIIERTAFSRTKVER